MEPTSKRAENRREAKQIRRELKHIRKHTDFNKLMQADDIANLSEDNRQLLLKKEHPDQGLQNRFDRAMGLLKDVLTRESRLLTLAGDKKEYLPTIQE